jgi:hypothetical protein
MVTISLPWVKPHRTRGACCAPARVGGDGEGGSSTARSAAQGVADRAGDKRRPVAPDCKDASASSAAVSAGTVVNGVAAAPIMVLLMIMAGRRRVMGEFTIGYGLKTLGWAATLAMVACVIGMVVTALV